MLCTLDDVDIEGRKVLVRADLNVPLTATGIVDDSRINASVKTLRDILERGGVPVLMSHLGRPKGRLDPTLSLSRIAPRLAERLPGTRVITASDCIGKVVKQTIDAAGPGELVLLENLRFHAGEESNDDGFASQLADLGEVYVNDAFSASHREHASIVGVAQRLPAVAGRLLEHEVTRLEALLLSPQEPSVAIIGGAKVVDKLAVIAGLRQRFRCIAVGGLVANTFLHAGGGNIGASLFEVKSLVQAQSILNDAHASSHELLLPVDTTIVQELAAGVTIETAALNAINSEDIIADIGPMSIDAIRQRLSKSATVVWAGPLGAVDYGFDGANTAVARCIAELSKAGRLRSVVGGGDTVAALRKTGLLECFDHVSLAGGAFLEWLEKGDLPGLLPLRKAV